jgi:uncharacterized coiled-coil protein SlyX
MKCRPTDIMQARIDSLEARLAGLEAQNATQERLIMRLWRINADMRRRLSRTQQNLAPRRETALDRAEAVFRK